MSRLSYHLGKKGQLNTPGITYASKKAAEELLLKDAEDHHCFFRASGFHNHLSHHILAAYDLGSPAGHLQKIYDEEAKMQRPKILEESNKNITVTKDNWVQYLGNQSAYSAFVTFFANKILALGVTGTLEKYVFDEDANANGAKMLSRVVSGAVHPFIQIGYGIEFSNDTIIATGLAQAAVHNVFADFIVPATPASTEGITLLELLKKVYASDVLKPGPYDPNAFINARFKTALANGGAEEIVRLCAHFSLGDNITDTEVTQKIEEIIWTSVLLTFGAGRKSRKPRLDFFLMHILNSALFLRPFCDVLNKPKHKAALMRAYVPIIVLVVLSRGRPRIDPELLMAATDAPRPPVEAKLTPVEVAIGDPGNDADYNPWPAMIEGVRYHSDAHTLKAMRTLVYAAQHFGDTHPGEVVGAFHGGKERLETHVGISKLDGTVFVRAAGMLMDVLGWSGHGQKEGEWDRSALGWDGAWESGD